MAKNERKRTMVYSNVNKKSKKADLSSASEEDNLIDLDNEVVIGMKSFPKPNNVGKNKKKIKVKKKIKEGQPINKKNITPPEKIKLQKRKAIKKMSTIFLLFVLIVGGLVYFLLSPVFNTKKINVLNNNQLSAEQIINISGIKLNENMFKFSKNQVQKNILENPYVESAKISRNMFTNSVNIDVKERIATLMLEYGNSYVYINNQGYILEISTVKLDSPIIKGYVTPLEEVKPGKRLNKDDLERLEIVLRILEVANSNGLEKLITHIDIKNRKDFVLTMESEDKTVYLGECTDLSTQMLYVKEMIQREKGIEGEFFIDMDLNTSNPVFREKV